MKILHNVMMTVHCVIYDDNVMMIVHYVLTKLPLCYNDLRGGGAENNKVAKFWKITYIHTCYKRSYTLSIKKSFYLLMLKLNAVVCSPFFK